jgi:hypothetical protein
LGEALQGAQRRHRFDRLACNRGYVLEVSVVVQHRQLGTFGYSGQHQVSSPYRPMLATVGKQQHDLCRAVEVGLMRRNEWQRLDELVIHTTWVTSAEQGFEVEDAAAGHPPLALQVEELARDGGICEAGVDAVVQQVGQSPHA